MSSFLRRRLGALQKQFGTAGLIVAVFALVAVLAGGAYAASGALTGKQKREVKAIAKSFRDSGPTGPTGAQGPAGREGPRGNDGAKGATGATGAKGSKGGFGGTGAPGEVGPTGPTGPTGSSGGAPLPEGATATGYWAVSSNGTKTIKDGDGNMVPIGSSEVRAPISFPAEIPEGISSLTVRYQDEATFAETCGTAGGAGGTASVPKAPAKTLCVWRFAPVNLTFVSICANPSCALPGINNTGGFLKFNTTAEGPAQGAGTWAVTR
jgi:hypothetical protein